MGFLRARRTRWRHLTHAANDVLFLRRIIVPELVGVVGALPLIGRHGSETANLVANRVFPSRVNLAELLEKLARFLTLRGAHVLQRVHPLEHALLLVRGQIVELLQAIPELLLPVSRKFLEIGISLQLLLLVGGRKVFMTSQPVSDVGAGPAASLLGAAVVVLSLLLPVLLLLLLLLELRTEVATILPALLA